MLFPVFQRTIRLLNILEKEKQQRQDSLPATSTFEDHLAHGHLILHFK